MTRNPPRTWQTTAPPPPTLTGPRRAMEGNVEGERRRPRFQFVAALLAGSFVAAIVLGRTAGPLPVRVSGPAQFAVVAGCPTYPAHVPGRSDPTDFRATFLLDPETGDVTRWRTSFGDILLNAACSPWTDEHGRSQVAGTWRGMSAEGALTGSGIARFSCPDGAIMDRVSLDIAPFGPPCWAPGTEACVIFGAIDGRLYRLPFEGSGAPGASSRSPDPRAVPLAWRASWPGPDGVFIIDPSRPGDPRLAGDLLVSLEVRTRAAADLCPNAWELWWLQLGADGASIVAAGRLIEPGDAGESVPDRRFPVVAAQPDGSLVLASLVRRPGRRKHQLRVAPIRFDPRTGAPWALVARERILAEECIAIPPVFSADGRWVWCLSKAEEATPRALRLAVGIDEPPLSSVRSRHLEVDGE